MTDKQIIIDGVNVKDCKRRIGKDNYCRYYKRPCSENNYNCIWKKYLRKEQECEELKKQLERKEENYQKLLSKSNKYIHNLVDENVQDIINLNRRLEQFKVENEKFKKQVCGLRPELKSIINKTCSKYNIQAKTYHKKIVEIINNLDKLSKTLAEIKALAIVLKNICPEFIKDGNDSMKAINEILQKISECEVKNEN